MPKMICCLFLIIRLELISFCYLEDGRHGNGVPECRKFREKRLTNSRLFSSSKRCVCLYVTKSTVWVCKSQSESVHLFSSPMRIKYINVFAKTTIILSYLSVYCIKPICYDMIVAVLNYHSPIITIMVKNDNVLCINYTIKTETVQKQVQNLLKRLLFPSRQAFLLSKTAFKAA